MTEPEKDVVLEAEYKEKSPEKPEEKKKEPGLFSKFITYRNKNLAEMKKHGDPGLGEEFKKVGMDWGQSFSKGMAEVGREEEEKLSGKKSQFRADDDVADEMLFGRRSSKQPKQQMSAKGSRARQQDAYTDQEFIEKLCEFLRFVAEDDDIGMWQHRGKQFTEVDYVYLGKLLTRYLGYKVTLKKRDLSIE